MLRLRKILTWGFLFFFTLQTGACDTVRGLFANKSDKTKNNAEQDPAVSSGTDEKKPVKPKKILSAKTNPDDEKATQPNTDETSAPQATTASTPDDVLITPQKQDDKKSLKKVDLKTVATPNFQVEAPIHVTKRIGGTPERLIVDANYVFLDDGQNLIVYSDSLDFIGKASRIYPISKITPVTLGGQNLFYASEDNNVLELFSLTQDPTSQKSSLKSMQSFDVGGPFSWLDSKTLLVFLENRMQFLDFSDPNNITVLREIPIGGILDKLILKNHLYLSRGEFLDIVNLDTSSLAASLRIGQEYQFLGATRENDTNLLYIALLDEQKRAVAIETLKLNTEATGVTDLGLAQILPQPLTQLKANFTLGILFGKAEDQSLRLYDLKTKRFLRGPLDRQTDILATDFYEDWLYVIRNSDIAQYRLQIHRDIIDQFKPVDTATTQNPPLAQIGAEQTLKDEFSLSTGKGLSFDRTTKGVFLLDQNHVVALEETASGSPLILVSENLSENEFTTREIALPAAGSFKSVLTTPFGLLFATEMGDIYFLDVNLQALQKWPIQLPGLQSWTVAEQNDGYLLTVVSKKQAALPKGKSKSKTQTTENFTLDFYSLLSPTQIELTAQIPIANPGFVANMGYDMFALITQTGIEFYTARDLNEPRKIDDQTKSYILPATLIDAKLSPKKDFVYALLQDGTQRKIYVFDYEQPQNSVILMPVGDLGLAQFRGSSFSRGGQLFILPTAKGSYFYDLSNLKNQPEKDLIKAHWPLPAEGVDVAARGQFVCTALGPRGVWCGDLLFY